MTQPDDSPDRDTKNKREGEPTANEAEGIPPHHPSASQVVSSVFAAAFGVQSKKNRERDFQHGKPIVFITAGIVFTLLFIASIFVAVSLVLKSAG